MISGWMQNGDINEFVKAHPDVNLLELVGSPLKFPHPSFLTPVQNPLVGGRLQLIPVMSPLPQRRNLNRLFHRDGAQDYSDLGVPVAHRRTWPMPYKRVFPQPITDMSPLRQRRSPCWLFHREASQDYLDLRVPAAHRTARWDQVGDLPRITTRTS